MIMFLTPKKKKDFDTNGVFWATLREGTDGCGSQTYTVQTLDETYGIWEYGSSMLES